MTDPRTPDQRTDDSKSDDRAKSTPGAYLSPKLREKLMEAEGATEEWSPKSGPPVGMIITVLVILGIAFGGFTLMRSAARKEAAKKAAAAAAAARADSLATLARAESLMVAARADLVARAAADSVARRHGGKPASASGSKPTASSAPGAKPAGSAAKPGGAPAGGTAAPRAESTPTSYGIAVGTYMFEDRANSERDRLSGTTGLPGVVKTATEGGTTVYRVLLGEFTSRAAAEKKASALMDSSLVREARVMARPK